MTPSARCQAVIELLEATDSGNIPADSLVSRYFRARRYAGSGDRRAIQALFYQILRQRGQIDWWLYKFDIEITPRMRTLAALAMDSPWDVRQSEAAFRESKFGTAPLSPSEQAIFGQLSAKPILDAGQPPAVQANVPAWMEPEFIPEIRQNWDIEMKIAAAGLTAAAAVMAAAVATAGWPCRCVTPHLIAGP